MITDLKTSKSADPDSFAKDIFIYKYYQQAAFCIDGFRAATGETIDAIFSFFVVEKTEPYVCSAFELGEKSIEAGKYAYRKALDTYKKCLETNHWPPYREQITMIDMPPWALSAAGWGPERVLV